MSQRLTRMVEERLARRGITLVERHRQPRGYQRLLVRDDAGREAWISCASTPKDIEACANSTAQVAVRKLKEASH